ncbi:hypothetical protein CUMW_198720 [Citrus unshiu]|nr:hypothetical protein CUMW_198720 [Citrus unshiu]
MNHEVSGLLGRVIDMEFILVRMGVDMLANSSGGPSMALSITISEMGTHMLENILRTRYMDLVSIVLPMGINMEEPGIREAQQAAEKACDVAKVDEKVNRAAAAAGRAVNAAKVAAFKAVQKQTHHNNSKDNIFFLLYDIYLCASHIVVQLS